MQELSDGNEIINPQPCDDTELCRAIEHIEGLVTQQTAQRDELYAFIESSRPYDSLTRKEAELYDANYATYRSLLDSINTLSGIVVDAYELLQRAIDNPTLVQSDFEAMLRTCEPYLPLPGLEQGVSIRKKTTPKTLGSGAISFSGLETDPRRIETGRNATKVVWHKGIDPVVAEQEFMDASSGTHGGKVRYKGKNGQHYIGKNGRRIRKK